MINEFTAVMLDRPSIGGTRCAICGAPATNAHHVIQKGMGGTSYESRIPTIKLCGSGVTGCHGLAHQKRLHIYWRDGWVYLITSRPINDFRCWQTRADEYRPVPGWIGGFL